ncbi:MAG TPA: redoxin domain-containing protein [Bacteroidia bacterium]|nr:redoxin domain-containing protein [Bacteroidia bacterium]
MHVLAQKEFKDNVTISGYAKNYIGKKIGAYGYSDMITFTERELAVTTVNDSGFYQLSLYANHIKYIYLRIGHVKGDMYVEPDRNYHVIFPARDSVRFVNPNADQEVDLGLFIKDSTDINSLVVDFNDHFNDFWEKNYQYFVKKVSRVPLDNFKKQMEKLYAPIHNVYFHAYIDYTFASLEENTFQGQRKLTREYIYNRPIHPESYEYMTFFNHYFTKYLQVFAASKKGANVYAEINDSDSYVGLLNVMKNDTILNNDSLRELVLLKGLSELYYTDGFNRANIIYILQDLKENTSIEIDKTIAENILNSFSRIQSGSLAPDFALPDKEGIVMHLSDFKGKYIYLSFMEAGSAASDQEMSVMEELNKKYGHKIKFITVFTDKDEATVKKYLKENPSYNWTFLYNGKNEALIDKYDVFTIPMYFFIAPSGNFIESPADSPSGGIESVMFRHTREQKHEFHVGDKKD